jgi:pterin-4a-carbinolamine dehydratase
MLLSDEEIDRRLRDLEGWEREGDAIARSFDRGDFVGSVRFVDAIVGPAEERGTIPTSRSPGRRSRSGSRATRRAA